MTLSRCNGVIVFGMMVGRGKFGARIARIFWGGVLVRDLV